jgi:hypothetical protein
MSFIPDGSAACCWSLIMLYLNIPFVSAASWDIKIEWCGAFVSCLWVAAAAQKMTSADGQARCQHCDDTIDQSILRSKYTWDLQGSIVVHTGKRNQLKTCRTPVEHH